MGTIAVLIVAGCGGSSSNGQSGGKAQAVASYYTGWPTQGTPKHGGTLTVDLAEAPNTFNPTKITTGLQAFLAVNEYLFALVPTSGDRPPVLKGILVSSWSLSPDRLTYTFHLRPGLRFSNGQPMTAEDAAFTLNLMKLYLSNTQFKSASATGKLTVKVQLKKPEVTFLESFNQWALVLPKSVYEREGGTKFGEHPVGMGPYMFKSSTSGNAIVTLVRNPYYTSVQAGQPYLNTLVFNQVESDNARILGVRSGSAQIAEQIPYGQVPALKVTPGVKVLVGPLWGASYIQFNRNKAPYTDVNVRKALEYATPREQIIESVYKGIGKVPNALGGELQYWDPNSATFPYDIAKAKELLKHSSVPNGFNMTITTVGGETQGELAASILQSSYAKIGVHVTIQSQPLGTFVTNAYAGKFDYILWPPETGYSNWYSPDAIYGYMLDNNYGQANLLPHASAKVLAELATARASNNDAEREKLFRKIQYQSYIEEALFIPGTTLATINLVSDNVRGFQVIPSLSTRWNEVWLTS